MHGPCITLGEVSLMANNHGMGRIIRPDVRDLQYPARFFLDAVAPLAVPTQRFYRPGPVLDQGELPECVGYAWRQWLASAPLMYRAVDPSADAIYQGAKLVDEFPGEDYDGTTVRAGVKVLQGLGLVEEYRWALHVNDVRDWLLSGQGCVVIGSNWYDGMMTPKKPHYTLRASGAVIGGHAYIVMGYNQATDLYRVLNSWGLAWGDKGKAWLPGSELATLLAADGEACCAIEK